jgi:hypothetical protein
VTAVALETLQRRFQDAVTGPGADAGGLVRGSVRLSADDRLELYRRSYRRRLIESMRALHPALRHALGDAVFDAFAADYLEAHPPRGYTLGRLGAAFADHLAATRPDGDEQWPGFVIDLARIEWAFFEVYEGPGTEGSAPDPQASRFEPSPCLRLLRSDHPVGAYLRAVRRGRRPELPGPATTFTALGRRDYAVTLVDLGARQYDALAAGAPIAGAPAELRAWADAGLIRPIRPEAVP